MGALGHAERVCKRLQAEQDCKPLQAKRVCKPDQPWLAGRYASLIELIIVKAAGWQSNYVSQAFPGCDNLFLVLLVIVADCRLAFLGHLCHVGAGDSSWQHFGHVREHELRWPHLRHVASDRSSRSHHCLLSPCVQDLATHELQSD